MHIGRTGRVRLLGLLAIGVLIISATLIQLDRQPPLWWDEGWTLVVARNWAVDGFFGRYLAGTPDSPGLAGGFPVIAPVAASFRLLGVGVWQGRLPGVLCLWAAFALLYFLADRLYNRAVAVGAVVVTLLMSVGPWLHPLIVGRQVLGEAPTVFYLLAGYACLWGALRRRAWLILLAVCFFAISIRVKAQVPPFWMVSMLLPFAVAVYRRWWRAVILLVIAITGSYFTANYGIAWLQGTLIAGHSVVGSGVAGLVEVTAVVLDLNIRLDAISIVLTFGLPTLIGLAAVVLESFRGLIPGKNAAPREPQDLSIETVKLALLGLTGSWLAWFVLLGMSYPRYLFPVIFIGSIFTSALLYRLTMHFSLQKTVKQANAVFLHRQFKHETLGALLAVILIAVTVPFNLFTLDLLSFYIDYNPNARPVAEQVDAYLNIHTPSQALIETYDSELFFLLDRRYHYPPDDVHVALIRRADLKQDVSIEYNPLAADPDYLVVGHFSRKWHLYDNVIASGAFHKIEEFPGYEIYERVR
jgi:hypothetical protein